MEKKENTPIWVFLAFSSIKTRKGALILFWSSLIFGLYCIPWGNFFINAEWIAKIFLIDDWSWAAMMFPMCVWYWLGIKWADKNAVWADQIK